MKATPGPWGERNAIADITGPGSGLGDVYAMVINRLAFARDEGTQMSTPITDAEMAAAVTDTILDYAEAVDGSEVERWVDLFCADGTFDEGRVLQGHEALDKQFRLLMRLFDATAHHMSNIRIQRTGDDTATATSYVYAWHRKVDGEDFEIWGRYLDEMRVERGRWRFAHRRVEMFGSRGMDVPLDRAPRRTLD
jgi:ketosteroid isomerase-like protein